MNTGYRTNNCGSLTKNDLKQNVILSGWIHAIRVKKNAIFLDLRDRYGLTQIVIKSDEPNFDNLKKMKVESVIQVTGQVVARQVANPKLTTGAIEVVAEKVKILSEAKALPFVINDSNNFTALEDLRLKYRYLDLRRKEMLQQLKFKHQFLNIIRNFLIAEGFLEVDTPVLTKSTPEGARDFLVPARIKKNAFYALPQSPQLYKQLLMISGIDKYYQIAKCFRDEDFRADRQPEFQQLDLEMAFVKQADVIELVEKLMTNLWKQLNLPDLVFPLPWLSYQEAIDLYGSDKPDLRCVCKIVNLPSTVKDLFLKGFWVNDKFTDATKKAILRIVEQHQGKNFLVYSRTKGRIIFSTNNKIILNETQLTTLGTTNAEKEKDLCYLTYESDNTGAMVLGAIRTFYCLDQERQAKHPDFLANINTYRLLWIVDWPMFEKIDNKISACHHPFTSPLLPEQVLDLKQKDFDQLLKIKASAYDLVLNGNEIAGGSVRIFDKQLQAKIFEILQLKPEIVKEQFGFFLDAFDYGVPPHAGIAFGIDRLLMILAKNNSIRDTIAFPKNSSGIDLLTNSPSAIDVKQLQVLGLKILNDKK
ncbi:Aspartate--tRNA ligase [Spiroplasma sp. JKS002669]|uniref:aspartate--tRNA ligase n=1 Tax=Spiroplasma attinicola TaxID=2904537 RepID=UPI0020BE2DCD|nr:aspartate--tRNA ligase [Spiroplasma sp. JKS002669]MCL6428644.1 Aspartate--tRNA ligase [Spiroplasma sp. JKS002669]